MRPHARSPTGFGLRDSIDRWLPRQRVRLSRAEETALVARARGGDAAAVETLVAAMAHWIARLVAEHFGPRGRRVRDRVAAGEPLDDLLQQGVLAMLERLPSFDPARGRLTTWLALVVVQGVSSWRHRHRSVIVRPNFVPGPNVAAQNRADRVAALDAARVHPRAGEPLDDLDRRQQLADLEAAIAALPPRLEAVIRARLAGTTLRALADELGVSRQRVGQLEAAARAHLAAALVAARAQRSASATSRRGTRNSNT